MTSGTERTPWQARSQARSPEDLGGEAPCWAHLVDTEPDDQPTQRSPLPMAELQIDSEALAQLMHTLADAVVVADTEGVIVYWNAAAERVFGWSGEQAIGQSLDLIIPERQRNPHWDGYRKVMATGETRYGDDLLRVPSLHADGQRRSIAFTVTLLKDGSGAVSGIAAVVRDETQRWADEQELRRRAREAET